jgi:hypothetical protein
VSQSLFKGCIWETASAFIVVFTVTVRFKHCEMLLLVFVFNLAYGYN